MSDFSGIALHRRHVAWPAAVVASRKPYHVIGHDPSCRFHERNFGRKSEQQESYKTSFFQQLDDWLRGGATTETDIR
ncbi:MAG: hypothetical protein WCE35_12490 [Bradyrhizobium sp.]